jgi:hypothetical protein
MCGEAGAAVSASAPQAPAARAHDFEVRILHEHIRAVDPPAASRP